MNLSTIEQGEELLKQSSRGPWTLNIGRFGYPASIDCAIPNEPVVYRGIEGDGGVCMKEDAEFIVWLQNHASELLQMAREVESLRKENAHIKNFQYDEKGRIKLICPNCGEKRVY
jgi:hypothetical protein